MRNQNYDLWAYFRKEIKVQLRAVAMETRIGVTWDQRHFEGRTKELGNRRR